MVGIGLVWGGGFAELQGAILRRAEQQENIMLMDAGRWKSKFI